MNIAGSNSTKACIQQKLFSPSRTAPTLGAPPHNGIRCAGDIVCDIVCGEDTHDDDLVQHDTDLLTEPRVRPVLPPLYRVIMLNDDYTPMLFVVHILRKFFNLDEHQATRVMLAVHTQGKGVCGVFSRDVAETKVSAVNRYARENEHPLLCEVEAVEQEDEPDGDYDG